MKPEARTLIDRARLNVDAARDLLDAEYPDLAASRAYHGACHAAEALLLERGLSPSRRSAAIAQFKRRATEREGASADLYRLLSEAFDHRDASDGADSTIGDAVDPKAAAHTIERVESLIGAVTKHFADRDARD